MAKKQRVSIKEKGKSKWRIGWLGPRKKKIHLAGDKTVNTSDCETIEDKPYFG